VVIFQQQRPAGREHATELRKGQGVVRIWQREAADYEVECGTCERESFRSGPDVCYPALRLFSPEELTPDDANFWTYVDPDTEPLRIANEPAKLLASSATDIQHAADRTSGLGFTRRSGTVRIAPECFPLGAHVVGVSLAIRRQHGRRPIHSGYHGLAGANVETGATLAVHRFSKKLSNTTPSIRTASTRKLQPSTVART
jgi:hypothetical protein